MPLDAERARRHLADFHLEPLFVEELGWDRYPSHLDVAVDGQTYRLRGIAEKRGMAAFVVESGDDDGLPDSSTRRKIERQAAKSVHEHLIIYADGARTTQVWQWVRREPGRPTACRELHYQRGQSGEALIQRLDAVTFTLDEEASLSIVDVTSRARAAFDVERVTKRFYDRFKAEHDAFLGFIRGLESQEDLEWYASVMLNRLMFVYFIQKKGFLDSDRDYLRNRMASVQADSGPDQFHSFYRHFLLRLFHEGLGQHRRSSELDALLGRVPYLNGGLFDVHELERENPDIQIPDEAFERLFDFFDAYQWHLDDRPLRADNEINPDVLGYIFEKYVNQKQMGAYYTKEDITDYITSNTLIPRLFEKLDGVSEEFDFRTIAVLLAADPDRYIHSGVRYGNDDELPGEIAAGVDEPNRRDRWNTPAAPNFALPTETWREVVGRRQHYARLRATLEAGDVETAADLVALNLDLEQLALDLIETCDSPTLLANIYSELESLSVLDPTCGSGAFLFAALNILEPLYEGALERMAGFLTDDTAKDTFADITAITERVERHPNRTFFVLKTIVVNNLYGVDIMEEAVEICKLRLFLRLVSQVDRYEQLEPLPDIDFNIRAGNSLVGFVSVSELLRELGSKLDLDSSGRRIEERSVEVDHAFARFRTLQLAETVDDAELARAKGELRMQLEDLRAELNTYLAVTYGRRPSDADDDESWLETHLPFHWLVEFHEIMSGGGFDVIVGNPPYVEYRKVRSQYTVKGFKAERCGDLYAFIMERSMRLLAASGTFGMIVPVSVVSTDGFHELREVLASALTRSWTLSFAERPSKLFTGVEKRLTIWIGQQGGDPREHFVSGYRRWFAEERLHLLATARFVRADPRAELVGSAIPKITSDVELAILHRLSTQRQLGAFLRRSARHVVYYTRKLRYFVLFFDFVPAIRDSQGNTLEPTELKELRVDTAAERDSLIALLNSGLFFWFFSVYSDVRNVNRREILAFRCSLDGISQGTATELSRLRKALMDDLNQKSRWLTSDYGRHGVLTIQSFQPRLSKAIIDEIDRALVDHYNLTDSELDFIINFDFKYRMGEQEEAQESAPAET